MTELVATRRRVLVQIDFYRIVPRGAERRNRYVSSHELLLGAAVLLIRVALFRAARVREGTRSVRFRSYAAREENRSNRSSSPRMERRGKKKKLNSGSRSLLLGTYEFVHASFVDDDGHGDAEHGEDPQVPRGEPETLLQHLSRRAVRLDELVRDRVRGGPGSSSHCEARKNAVGRSGLVRGRSFGGVAGSSARGEGVRARKRLVRDGSARARTLGPTLRTRGAASRPSV